MNVLYFINFNKLQQLNQNFKLVDFSLECKSARSSIIDTSRVSNLNLNLNCLAFEALF